MTFREGNESRLDDDNFHSPVVRLRRGQMGLCDERADRVGDVWT